MNRRLYAQYTVTSSKKDTISIADGAVEGAFVDFDYIELGVQVSSVDSDVAPSIVANSEFISTVIVSAPILDEMELETERVNDKFETIDESLVNIRDSIDALENALTAGAQVYQTPLIEGGAPSQGRFYFFKQDNSATAFFNDPAGPVVGVMLTPYDATSGASRDWIVGLQPNESVFVVNNNVDDTNATYLITTFEEILDDNGEEVSHIRLDLQFISGTPHPSTAAGVDTVTCKTRLLNDGISRQEAEESYVSVLGDTIRGNLILRDNLNDLNTIALKPEEKIFRVGRTREDEGFTFQSYGLNQTFKHNSVVYEEVTDTSSTRYTPLTFASPNNNYISGLDTPEDTDLTYAANVEYVNTYVQEYVGDIVGVINPASKTKLGPVKLDKAGVLSQDADNQLSVRRATTGNNLSNVGVAGYNGSYFTITNYTDADTGVQFSRVNAKLISPTSGNSYGMTRIDRNSINVNDSNQLYVPSASSSTKGVMKIVHTTTWSGSRSWNDTPYETIAPSARALYKCWDYADDAYRARFIPGMALHNTNSSSVEVGGIYKSGSTFYLRVS